MVGVADVIRRLVTLPSLLFRAMEQPQVHTSAKPPNILLLRNSQRSNGDRSNDQQNGLDYQQAKADLATCIGQDRYVIYPLALEDVSRLPWQENCQLLIAPAHLNLAGSTPNVIQHLRNFVASGGKCLSMNRLLSDALASSVDEVREESSADVAVVAMASGLCRVTPCIMGEEGLEGFVASSLHSKPSQCGAAPQLKEEKDLLYTLLACLTQPGAEVNVTPLPLSPSACVHLVSDRCGQTRYVTSTVDLLLPSFEDLTVSMVTELKEATPARHVFLRAVLHQLGIASSPSSPPSLSYTFLFTVTDELRIGFLHSLSSSASSSSSTGFSIAGSDITIHLSTEDCSSKPDSYHPQPPPSPSLLSVLTNPAPKQLDQVEFDVNKYFAALQTTTLGRVLLYTPVITSTQTVFTGNTSFTFASSRSGVICSAGQQTRGKGRGGNEWISPKGCMMFSLPLHFPPSSRLNRCSSILQHITALSVVSAIRTLPGYEEVEVEIKWPNDIYYKRQVKLGGILVTAFSLGRETTAIVGCGVNVSNHYPTVSLNDCITLHQQEKGGGGRLEPLSVEQLLGLTLNKMEVYLRLYEKWGLSGLQDLYYEYWMHGGSKVELSGSPDNKPVIITGIDEFGYLRVRDEEGKSLTVHPDGNTFDIMKGLIAMKK